MTPRQSVKTRWFQHTAARRRLAQKGYSQTVATDVSTHSRPKAAGQYLKKGSQVYLVSTHSRPKAAGRNIGNGAAAQIVSTHSRPKAAGLQIWRYGQKPLVSTHSRPKAAGRPPVNGQDGISRFNTQPPEGGWQSSRRDTRETHVSTHSRPKAAGQHDADGTLRC